MSFLSLRSTPQLSHQGHDHAIDECGGHLAEGAAHDEGHGHVDQVAPHGEFLEFL
jgi:hypothetical protein